MCKKQEEEFLKLAGIYLACRFQAMGRFIIGTQDKGYLEFRLLGMYDYGEEMKLFLKEVLEDLELRGASRKF